MATAQNAARVSTTATRSRCVFFWPWHSADQFRYECLAWALPPLSYELLVQVGLVTWILERRMRGENCTRTHFLSFLLWFR